MGKVTISFTIEKEQLERVDKLATELDRDRSSTLRQLVEAGIPAIQSARKALVILQERKSLPIGITEED